ncbi:Nif3-like dinuclear metal center hexameric protein [Butyrivibrio sp. INlla21]|uniref:Nif3-like dinuclear metal center hexameric protein n=1 Tax=Butyrivibrio sp. INlla21 TaxID=1520811 RepID=UPI0008F2FCC2|nr:Nif3-like dinuclear metal center hexameric protein [Butyrivibrio sp. INlla21]SFU93889.1 Putative GTP cyclohydrolase 1 type 2, NIF3 family [Butyrivibrio sp. INlla21]
MTVKELIEEIIVKSGSKRFSYEETCDHLIIGDENMEITGIVTTFMATVDVINEAVKIGANMIITHEPTWFTGIDKEDWLRDDPVYLEKKKLLEDNKIAVWRFHDHMHAGTEDGIYRGFDEEFGWAEYREVPDPDSKMSWFGATYVIPQTTLSDLAGFFKDKLDMNVVQLVGNPDMKVKRVGVLVGGGSLGLGTENLPMIYMKERNIDVCVCGDITEWTLSAYVRDASQLGMNKAMIVIGHERSEECGMKHLPAWLKSITGDIPVTFIDAKEPFTYLV